MVRGLYPGAFDLLHPGHLFGLDWAREHCDHLTAAININPTCDNPKKEKPLESALDRFVRLLSCKFVDNITYYEGEKELESLYRFGAYDVAFISVEHEKCYTPTHKAQPVFVPRLSEHSSTRLRQKIRGNSRQQSAVSNQPDTFVEEQPTSLSQTEHREPRVSESHSLEFHAERQHEIWARWMDYQFSLCQEQTDGSLIIPADEVARWKRRLATPYDGLTEAERESDREVVREHLREDL